MTIDGINIESIYGAKLLYGSLSELAKYPSLKKPLTNDWAEEDGIEVDLVAPVLDKKNLSITFLIAKADVDSFSTFLMLKTYRDYYSLDLMKVYTLRCDGISGINKPQGKFSITLKLIDDYPLKDYSYSEPFLDAQDMNCSLDGKNMSEYGFVVLDGTESSLENSVGVKKKLEVSSQFLNGAVTSEQESKRKEVRAELNIGIRQSVANFWAGYSAFLYALVQPNERTLILYGNTFTIYYVSSDVSELIVKDGEVWCNFRVKINVI